MILQIVWIKTGLSDASSSGQNDRDTGTRTRVVSERWTRAILGWVCLSFKEFELYYVDSEGYLSGRVSRRVVILLDRNIALAAMWRMAWKSWNLKQQGHLADCCSNPGMKWRVKARFPKTLKLGYLKNKFPCCSNVLFLCSLAEDSIFR